MAVEFILLKFILGYNLAGGGGGGGGGYIFCDRLTYLLWLINLRSQCHSTYRSA